MVDRQMDRQRNMALFIILMNVSDVGSSILGTTERVCLITGNVDAIITVLTFVMEKIKEKPDPNAKADYEGKNAVDREKQVIIFFQFLCGCPVHVYILCNKRKGK